VEHDGGTLRNAGQPDHAALPEAPARLHRRRLAAIAERRRCLEFGNQELRLVNLRDHHDLAEPRRERRMRARALRDQRDAGIFAAHFEAEREAGHRALAAGIDTARLRFLRGPRIRAHADLGRGIEPERAPGRGGNDQQGGHDEKAPQRAPARRGGHVRHAASFG
jgi:hypothetical protein